MKKLYLILPVLTLLFSCNTKDDNSYKPGRTYGDDKYYALFMYNYPRVTGESANGYEEKYDNPLYLKQEIQINQLITEPEVAPERDKYEFQGWFRESACTNPWNFELDYAKGSTFLYAKWGVSSSEEYVEPEYIYPERIIEDMNFKVTGILNKELKSSTEVDLTVGAINRLKKSPSDVKFAINYERKEDVTLDVATFDVATSTIHIETSASDVFNIYVNDITASLNIANMFPGQRWVQSFEDKAKGYEQRDYDLGNYHVALMGSSSMENWDTSTEDMAPIATFNYGIGGTTVENWTQALLERLVTPYSPKLVAYYVGVNNIINSGKNGTETGQALVNLFNETHRRLPEAKILYILINKLPGYMDKQPEFDIANNYALEYEASHDFLKCVDAGVGLLKDNGLPHYGYFRSDGLHMSRYGYVIWGAAVKKAIQEMLG